MKRYILKHIKNLQLGDLIRVDWFDARICKSLAGGSIDVPVVSWGVYLGIMDDKNKHVVLDQNNFRYADGFFDINCTTIPVTWASKIHCIIPGAFCREEAEQLVKSFSEGATA